ncbi:MAG: DinB family protein [Bacteroidota bacterium]
MKNESQTIASILDETRKLTWTVFDQVHQKADIHRRFVTEGVELNSAYWIMAHLAVTQNYLVLRTTGGEAVRFPWAKMFGMGVPHPSASDCPPFEEIKSVLNDVHERSVKHIMQMDPTKLELPNSTGFGFLGESTNRSALVHAIRHENMHAGHLSWICKLSGLHTI